jgi:hypothetical protein
MGLPSRTPVQRAGALAYFLHFEIHARNCASLKSGETVLFERITALQGWQDWHPIDT